ncbi:hypothetical protein [Gallaecimonas mangrovi]|uniref:hypothetical protein n=1 Tax=Gallaecimonas mangrovi TaxID=2291597 RepID=UPI0018668674|nr:hypothetical protein [Gallaecimonas mangrovi]
MPFIKRFVLPALCLIAALSCYSASYPAGGTLLLLMGAGFEALFWMGFLKKNRAAKA